MAAADRITCDHRDHRFWAAADLLLEVEDVEAMDASGIDISCIAADPLVAARTKCVFSLAR